MTVLLCVFCAVRFCWEWNCWVIKEVCVRFPRWLCILHTLICRGFPGVQGAHCFC